MTENPANLPAGTGDSAATIDAPMFAPPTDIYETGDEFTMLLEMPGADPATLDVTLDKQMLMVSARSTPWTPQGYTLVHAEYRSGNYERAFTLSDAIDDQRIDAVFENGLLRLTLPKAKESRAKKIAVKTS